MIATTTYSPFGRTFVLPFRIASTLEVQFHGELFQAPFELLTVQMPIVQLPWCVLQLECLSTTESRIGKTKLGNRLCSNWKNKGNKTMSWFVGLEAEFCHARARPLGIDWGGYRRYLTTTVWTAKSLWFDTTSIMCTIHFPYQVVRYPHITYDH